MMWALALVAQVVVGQKLREQYSWYRTGDEIHAELQDLSSNCPNADFQISTRSAVNSGENAGQQVQMDIVHISKKGSPGEKKAFFVFGEHARELISPETGLQFMKTLCGQGSGQQRDLAERVLSSTSFVIMPNANPLGRKRVEAGEYCKRTNEDGVDLNRNWGDQHRDTKRANTDDEMNPGSYGFSEPEAQVIRDAVTEERPDMFLSIHSGAYFMGTPFGYTDNREPDNEDELESLLAPISDKYCGGGCPYGGLAGMIGYKSIGCDIDYVKEQLNVPIAMTWEIYIGPSARPFYIEKARARSENREMNDDAQQFFYGNGLNFLQNKVATRKFLSHARMMTPESKEKPEDCFEQFNPESQAETEQVTANWAGAFLTLCDEVASKAKTSSSLASQAVGSTGANNVTSSASTSDKSASPQSPDTYQDYLKFFSQPEASSQQPATVTDGAGSGAQPAASTDSAGSGAQPAAAIDGAGSGASTKSQNAPQDTEALPKGSFLSAVESLKEWSDENQ